MLRLIIYTGKGGTGKTVTSCATAIKVAEHNYETLAYEIAMLPGMTQLFSLLKVEEVDREKTFDVVILDMPASGEALRYLYFPKLVGSIGRKLTGLAGLFSGFAKIFQPLAKFPTPAKDVMQSEMELLDRLNALSDIINNNNRTSVRLVANPDTFSIENAKRVLMSTSLYGINVDMAIINKIMASSLDEYYAKWATFHRSKVEEAKANFYPLPVREAELYGTELRGIDMLRKHGEILFGSDDPSKILYHGEPYMFVKEGTGINMTVQVPFTEKDDFRIERYGDQLTITVKTTTGQISNVVPLPVATAGMKLVHAKLLNQKLKVQFDKEPL